jgi:hypothetical protein
MRGCRSRSQSWSWSQRSFFICFKSYLQDISQQVADSRSCLLRLGRGRSNSTLSEEGFDGGIAVNAVTLIWNSSYTDRQRRLVADFTPCWEFDVPGLYVFLGRQRLFSLILEVLRKL